MRCKSTDLLGKRAEELALPMQPYALTSRELLARYITETMKDGNISFEYRVQRFERTEVPLEVIDRTPKQAHHGVSVAWNN